MGGGCDFYSISICVVTLKNGKEINIQYERLAHWWYNTISPNDDDFTIEAQHAAEEKEMARYRSHKKIYENGEWHIPNKQKYYDIISRHNDKEYDFERDGEPKVPVFNDILSIYTRTYCQERY